jgi:hypothetical protein
VNVLPAEKRLRVLAALVDGNSERAVERMTDVPQKTVGRLALTLGAGAQRLHDRLVRDLSCSMIQVDEIWSYVQKKQARVDPAKDGPDVGEAYTFVALDTSSRLVISFHVGKRDQASTDVFIADVRARLVVMPAMTSDGFAPYIKAIGASFGPSIAYAQTIKHYRHGATRGPDHRYEPPRDPFITKKTVYGSLDLDRASTAYIERNNGTMRHHIGRIRRLCYAFSKKIENHRAAVALNYAWYNLGHVVKTLRVTPAMAAGVTDHVWSLEEFMDAMITAAPVAKPTAQPLGHRVPEGPARELPNGRGFLRVVGGTSSPAKPPPAPVPPPAALTASAAPAAPAAPTVQIAAPVASGPAGQLDLLSWTRPLPPPAPVPVRPRRPVQLNLFGIEIEPEK